MIIYIYFGYPLFLIFISQFINNKVNKDENYQPTVSMLIAAYNEEKFIETKILNSLKLKYPKEKFEIVVVSDGSTDETDQIVKKYESQGVKLFRVEGRVGKTEARNVAVLNTQSDIIVFSDATAIYQEDAILKLVRNLADPTVGMVSGNLNYVEQNNGTMGLATKIYWNYESLIKKAQSKFKTLTGAIGCINAFKREAYFVLPPNIIEDFTEPLMIVSKNLRVVYEEEAIAYERTTAKPSQEFKMRVRVIRGGMTGFLFALKYLNIKSHFAVIFQLVSHKLLRWLQPVFFILLFLTTFINYFLTKNGLVELYLCLQILFYVIALLGFFIKIPGKIGKVMNVPTYFVTVNVASLKALYLTITSTLEATWETNEY